MQKLNLPGAKSGINSPIEGIAIRSISQETAIEACRLLRAVSDERNEQLTDRPISPLNDIASSWLASSSKKSSLFLLAIAKGKVVGIATLSKTKEYSRTFEAECALAGIDASAVWMASLAIAPTYRNMGIGSELHTALNVEAKNMDVPFVYGRISAKNPTMVHLCCEKLGFSQVNGTFEWRGEGFIEVYKIL